MWVKGDDTNLQARTITQDDIIQAYIKKKSTVRSGHSLVHEANTATHVFSGPSSCLDLVSGRHIVRNFEFATLPSTAAG